MTKHELKTRLSAFLAARDAALGVVDDDTAALSCVAIFPKMQFDGGLIKYQSRIQFDGKLYRARQDLWDTESSTPAKSPTLWSEIIYSGGIREIPETITADAAFSAGEKGKWKGEIYISLIDNNVWTPDQYPAGWKKDA